MKLVGFDFNGVFEVIDVLVIFPLRDVVEDDENKAVVVETNLLKGEGSDTFGLLIVVFNFVVILEVWTLITDLGVDTVDFISIDWFVATFLEENNEVVVETNCSIGDGGLTVSFFVSEINGFVGLDLEDTGVVLTDLGAMVDLRLITDSEGDVDLDLEENNEIVVDTNLLIGDGSYTNGFLATSGVWIKTLEILTGLLFDCVILFVTTTDGLIDVAAVGATNLGADLITGLTKLIVSSVLMAAYKWKYM